MNKERSLQRKEKALLEEQEKQYNTEFDAYMDMELARANAAEAEAEQKRIDSSLRQKMVLEEQILEKQEAQKLAYVSLASPCGPLLGQEGFCFVLPGFGGSKRHLLGVLCLLVARSFDEKAPRKAPLPWRRAADLLWKEKSCRVLLSFLPLSFSAPSWRWPREFGD